MKYHIVLFLCVVCACTTHPTTINNKLIQFDHDLRSLQSKSSVKTEQFALMAYVPYTSGKKYPKPLYILQSQVTQKVKAILKTVASKSTTLSAHEKNMLNTTQVNQSGGLHVTIFVTNAVPTTKKECVIDSILQTLQEEHATLKKHFNVPIPADAQLEVFGNFVVLVFPAESFKPWENTMKKATTSITDNCDIANDFFTSRPWRAHVSLCRISLDGFVIKKTVVSPGISLDKHITSVLKKLPRPKIDLLATVALDTLVFSALGQTSKPLTLKFNADLQQWGLRK